MSSASDILGKLVVPPSARPFVNAVSPDYSSEDGMLAAPPGSAEPNFEHYFSVGASALNTLLAAISLGFGEPRTILDFGCGAGRVTRWLRAAFPNADLSACDVREQDVIFVREHFGARTWTSVTDVARLEVGGPFDLIWVGSVVTHLDEATSVALLRKLFASVAPRGLLVASVHGRTAQRYGDAGLVSYLHQDGWRQARAGYDKAGYGYADYVGQRGYGISLASPLWTANLPNRIEGARMVLFGEALWDNHHDVIALQKA
jgi:SAM-dependent methyltransferase